MDAYDRSGDPAFFPSGELGCWGLTGSPGQVPWAEVALSPVVPHPPCSCSTSKHAGSVLQLILTFRG